ncbi:uncharacterized protein Dwil_GK25507 [Drosophila willistoni]|uniref:THAP-type domain-containing protein n=1 Tax=Drosophila willistoni TaxID=7260 RepID=B4N3R9_DROWI|nr:uncharacterized protein LOC6645629 [Drosophila willistoni]EDW79274.2 uncharacterized protein Dwil_GK25507 [Drosophila willistoni]
MGGTRCVFRNCKVSSQRNPKMHFFKFPVRHPKRLEAWLKNCSNEEITELADLKKLANRAVCARHFRVECFMNYKMDRLIASQMPNPTLMRINKYLAWDIENLDTHGEPKMVKLEKPTAKHLIPPAEFECPLGFDSDDYADVTEEDEEMPDSLDADTIQTIDVKATKRKEDEEVEKPLLQQEKEELKQDTKRLRMLAFRLVDEGHSLENIEDEINTDVESVETSIQNAHDELQRKYDKLLDDHEQLKKSKASEMLSQTASSSSSLKTLTKTQLYQGLKKYLGPTMAALVRMEMFGGIDDREWQDDERQFAMELLQLGDEVYTYCSEEWRFRLPSLRLVRNWLNHQNDQL